MSNAALAAVLGCALGIAVTGYMLSIDHPARAAVRAGDPVADLATRSITIALPGPAVAKLCSEACSLMSGRTGVADPPMHVADEAPRGGAAHVVLPGPSAGTVVPEEFR